jgi:phospholipase C
MDRIAVLEGAQKHESPFIVAYFGPVALCWEISSQPERCGQGSATFTSPPPPPSKIQHVVIIFQENHALENDGSGPSLVSSIVNAIGDSSYWSNTAIFIMWDDWGGWYDHVAPKMLNSYEYGFRVPMIVVSPYAKVGYISHVTHDFGSILKFVEETYNLPSLGYANAVADDLSDCFNYNQTPTPFQTIAAPLKADYFLNDRRPPTGPDDD